jgi:hypothetical protein
MPAGEILSAHEDFLVLGRVSGRPVGTVRTVDVVLCGDGPQVQVPPYGLPAREPVNP